MARHKPTTNTTAIRLRDRAAGRERGGRWRGRQEEEGQGGRDGGCVFMRLYECVAWVLE
jgi:hypothetical protein